MDEKLISEIGPLLKLAGYSGPIKPINEDELLEVLQTFKTNKCNVVIFSSNKKVDVDDMPQLVEAIMKIEGSQGVSENTKYEISKKANHFPIRLYK